MSTAHTFEDSRLDALELLSLAQDVLLVASDTGVVAHRAKQDTLSLICAAKAELRKAAPPRPLGGVA
ncbi:MAG: hypothetical protein ACRDQD_12025 [Nocardioidaceae bacterium]